MNSKTIILIFSLTLAVFSTAASQTSGRFNSFFSDYKAHQVGDILTIYIMEFSTGSNTSSTNTKNENNLNVGSTSSGALDFIPLVGLGTKHGNEYKGNGQVAQKGQLRAKMSAQIVDISESGNIKIEGKKLVEINGDKQTTILTGWVRPQDVTTDNVVYSYNIANAEIQYKGKGVTSSSAKPGLITKLINWIF